MTTTNNTGAPSPAFVPDVSVIAQLANQFFSALPGEPNISSVVPAPLVAVTSLPTAPAPLQPEPSALSSTPNSTVPAQGPAVSESLTLSPFSAEPSFAALGDSPFSLTNPFPKPAAAEGPHRDGNEVKKGVDASAVETPSADTPLVEPPSIETPASFLRPLPKTNEGELDKKTGLDEAFPGRTAEPALSSFDSYSFVPVLLEGTGRDAHPAFDAASYKRDFPILQQRINGHPLVWLDNAATTQKPQAVIDRLDYFYANENSNVHRAAHTLAARATDAYEGARDKVRRFLGASSSREIVFVRGATEAINLVAKAWGAQNIGEGDEIVVSWLEHHANIVPWQQLASEKGAKIRVIPVDDRGQVLLNEYEKLLNSKTKIVSVTQVSNALGTVVPVKEIVEIAHRRGIKTLVDGAQSVSHLRVNVAELDTDFFVFSGHKIFGPTGIGVLYGKEELLNSFQPWQGGGNMIDDVTFEKTLYQPAPGRFEAGTGNIADAVGLGAALDYLERVGLENVAHYEHELLVYGTQLLKQVSGLRIIGNAPEKAGVLSFVIDGLKNEEIGQALNQKGIAVRSGHHCAQPILRRFGLESTVRASLAFYNLPEDLEALARVLCDLTASKIPAAR